MKKEKRQTVSERYGDATALKELVEAQRRLNQIIKDCFLIPLFERLANGHNN